VGEPRFAPSKDSGRDRGCPAVTVGGKLFHSLNIGGLVSVSRNGRKGWAPASGRHRGRLCEGLSCHQLRLPRAGMSRVTVFLKSVLDLPDSRMSSSVFNSVRFVIHGLEVFLAAPRCGRVRGGENHCRSFRRFIQSAGAGLGEGPVDRHHFASFLLQVSPTRPSTSP